MARLMLMDLLVKSRAKLPIGRIVNVIDDISGNGIGSRGVLVTQMNSFAQGVVAMLKDKRLPINWGKTKVLASS
eukprot:7593474-Pyramimonas_sp.AAC.1